MKTIRRRQTTAPQGLGVLGLSGSNHFTDISKMVVSPYFQMTDPRKEAPGRNTHLFLEFMKAIAGLDYGVSGTGIIGVGFYTGSTLTDGQNLSFDMAGASTNAEIIANAETAINAYAAGQSYSLTEGILWVPAVPAANPVYTESALSLSLQTGTGAVGTQVSSTVGAWVTITGSISTTATIGGASSGDILVEVAPTNSATAGDWVEKGRIGNSQTITLALALNSVQITKGSVSTYVPAGYYVKARSIGSGTFTNTLLEARKVI